METDGIFCLCDYLSSLTTWRCLETSRILSFGLVSALYLMYIRAYRPLSWKINANYLVHSNKLWKPRHPARLLQFWTDIFENPSHSQRISSISIKPTRKQLSLYYKINFATKRNDRWVHRPLDTEYDRSIRWQNDTQQKGIYVQDAPRSWEL